MKMAKEQIGITLAQLLHFKGSFGSDLLWELLNSVARHLKACLKDPQVWENGPVLLICADKIQTFCDGTVTVDQGSIGEYSTSMHIAPEIYCSEFSAELCTASTIELVYVYSLGMMIYSAAEFNSQEEVELPDELEDVLLGMVQEVAALRTNLDFIIQACEEKVSQNNSLKDLTEEFLKENDKTQDLLKMPPPPIPPKPPSVDTLPRNHLTLPSNPSTSSTGEKLSATHIAHEKNDHEDAHPYATAEIMTNPRSSSTDSGIAHNRQDENGGYASVDNLMEDKRLNNKLPQNGHSANEQSKRSNGRVIVQDSPVPSMSSESEMENPYGTSKPRCVGGKECSAGNCRHTPNDISSMYTTVQKSKSMQKSQKSSSGRVDGFRFDTSISTGSSDNEQPIQLPMRKTGKPVIVQFPSNKRYQIPGQREDTVKSIFTSVTTQLGIEDPSLFSLLNCPVKGVAEFVSSEQKLKTLAPDKWKSDDVTSPPVELKLAVKFYPPNPHKFVNQVTKLQFFLSIRNLLLDGTYDISKEAAFDLAALSLQADLGDYYDQSNNYFEPHNYVPPEVMSSISYQYCSKEIPMLHSKLDDMSQNEAIIRYLQIASNLPDYGVHFYEVVERSPHELEHSWVGISLEAILLYEKASANCKTRGLPAIKLMWHEVANISYKNKTFLLDVAGTDRKSPPVRRYSFETESTKVSRQMMSLCADTHKFYIKIKKMLPLSGSKESSFSVRDYIPSPKSVITNNNPDDEADNGDTGITRTKSIARPETLQNKRPPPSDKFVQKYVCLTKTTIDQSLGMTIVGGDGTHGIYVEHLAPRGLANLDGRIKPGDMLLSVNGSSLKSMTHQEAVNLIVEQDCRVELELVENSGCVPYGETDNLIAGDLNGERKKLNKSTPSVNSSTCPWFVRASKNTARLTGDSSSHNTLLSNKSNNNSDIPESLQKRMAMQDRYNLVRQPQVATSTTRGHSSPQNNLSQDEASGVTGSADNADYNPVNGKLDNQLARRLTRGSSEQISFSKDDIGSYNGSFISDNSVERASHKDFRSSASVTNSEGDKTEFSSRVSSSREPFSRIFSVYLTKRRSSLGLSVRVDKGAVYVKDVVPHGPAATSGMIETGDSILSVNGVDISDMPHQEVVNVLQTAPTNVTLVMSWATKSSKEVSDTTRIGMQFRVTLNKTEAGFGFTNRSTFMGSESFVRIKTVHERGHAAVDGSLEEGDILLSAGGYSLENVNDRILANILTSVATPTEFVVYRPDTIRTFNPRKNEAGSIMSLPSLNGEDLSAFTLCQGYPYSRISNQNRKILPNDRLLRIGNVCCQGIKSPQLQSIINETTIVGAQIFRPSISTSSQDVPSEELENRLCGISLSEPNLAQMMENAETVTLEKKEQGLGFSLLGQQDGKRIVHGVTVKTVLEVGAAYDEGRLAPGDLIIMVNGQSMVGVTQSKALRIIRKCSGQVVLTVVPATKRDLRNVSSTERKLIGLE